ncbi:MAG: hypothetical protein RL000_1967, partial [Bacteroidota bacterium]
MTTKIVLTLAISIATAMGFLYKSDIPLEELKRKYTNEHSKFIPVMGMSVHYRDEGNPNDSTPLVLVHGTSSSLHT